jgi:hypothetical protein
MIKFNKKELHQLRLLVESTILDLHAKKITRKEDVVKKMLSNKLSIFCNIRTKICNEKEKIDDNN